MGNHKRQFFKIQRQGVVLLFLLFISGLLLAFSAGGFVLNFKQIGFSILSGIQKGIYSISSTVTGTFSAINELSVLRKQYNELTQKIENYEFLQRTNAEIRMENKRLKDQLGFSDSLIQNNIAAEIIGKDPNSLYSGITINKGTRDGVKKNMPVVAFQNGNTGLVGKIIEVGQFTSMIMPVYDFQCYVSARIQTTRDQGLVNGQGSADFNLIMQYVKKRVYNELQHGDVVVTSGENFNYAKDIPIGTITNFRALDYDTSLEIELTPIVDFSRLETVFVLDISKKNTEGESS